MDASTSRMHISEAKMDLNAIQVGVSPTNITLEVSKSTFAKNTVKDNGGSLQVSGAIQAQVIDVKIEKSTASSGGAMWVDGTGSLEMEDVQLMQNTASKDGGGAVLNTVSRIKRKECLR